MSLVQALNVSLKDLLPAGQAVVLPLPGVVVPYQISLRLHQALKGQAEKDRTDIITVFQRLVTEINEGGA